MTSAAAPFLGCLIVCVAGAIALLAIPERLAARAYGWLACIASLLLFAASITRLAGGGSFELVAWTVAPFGPLRLAMDPLAGFFGAMTAVTFAAGSICAVSHFEQHRDRYPTRAMGAVMLLLLASLALVLAAGDALLLLLAWEGMSVFIYVLVQFGSNQASRPGYLMLVLGEAGTLAIAIGLLIAAAPADNLSFMSIRAGASGLGETTRFAVFLLTFFGFGVKAGLVPVNVWLPRTYAAAPGAFAPILAGTTLNLGLYGIVRVNADLVPPLTSAPGLVALMVGTVSALIGILYATTATDMKRMLAHSSIENAGVITAGLGAGLVFVAAHMPLLAGIALTASLYHTMNHAVYKTLLFGAQVAVEDRVHTRDMNLLGGLIKRMPWTAACFLIGSLSIAAIPPTNGFVSEWLTLQSLLRSVELAGILERIVFAVCGAALALTAALAVTCFVRAFAMTFLGMARSEAPREAHDAPRGARVAMACLGILCALLGVLPTYIIPAIDRAAESLTGANATAALVPDFFAHGPAADELPTSFVEDFRQLGGQIGRTVFPGRGLIVLHRGTERNPVVFAMSTWWMSVMLLVLLAIVRGLAWAAGRRRRVVRRPRWDGGVHRLLPEMTYTATGFSNPVRVIFAAILRPSTVEDTQETVAEHFRTAIRKQYRETHILDRYVLFPTARGIEWLAALVARMHDGHINTYVSYVVLMLLLFLAIARF